MLEMACVLEETPDGEQSAANSADIRRLNAAAVPGGEQAAGIAAETPAEDPAGSES